MYHMTVKLVPNCITEDGGTVKKNVCRIVSLQPSAMTRSQCSPGVREVRWRGLVPSLGKKERRARVGKNEEQGGEEEGEDGVYRRKSRQGRRYGSG